VGREGSTLDNLSTLHIGALHQRHSLTVSQRLRLALCTTAHSHTSFHGTI